MSKVNALISTFRNWKAKGFVKDTDPSEVGLVPPSATVTVTTTLEGTGCTIKVGKEDTSGNNYFAQRDNQPDVLLVPKWSLDRVLLKSSDLLKPPNEKPAE